MLMEELGLHPADQTEFDVSAKLTFGKTRGSRINLRINSNPYSGNGPYLDFNETIKSYGLRFTRFTPQYQEMIWDEAMFTLTVIGQNYQFILEFDQPK